MASRQTQREKTTTAQLSGRYQFSNQNSAREPFLKPTEAYRNQQSSQASGRVPDTWRWTASRSGATRKGASRGTESSAPASTKQ